mmetsp:Transcript_26292/g.49956  ORF Transcript_26292/g.49956 Transcript_26292/m.49956 type:complete len:249 (+) Transcript_26292:545-1291(+)
MRRTVVSSRTTASADGEDSASSSSKPASDAHRLFDKEGRGWSSTSSWHSWSSSSWHSWSSKSSKSKSGKSGWSTSSTDYPTVFPTVNPTLFPTVSPTEFPTLYPTQAPTYCGKHGKSGGKSGGTSSGKSGGKSGSSWSSWWSSKSESCHSGSRSSKSGKSGHRRRAAEESRGIGGGVVVNGVSVSRDRTRRRLDRSGGKPMRNDRELNLEQKDQEHNAEFKPEVMEQPRRQIVRGVRGNRDEMEQYNM